jgi:hypothetical protein
MTLGKRGWMADMRDFETFQAALGLKEPWFVALVHECGLGCISPSGLRLI